jgi:hypothetical protein
VQNLLEKFSPEAEVEKGDEGMVLIEYVVFGGVLAAMITGALIAAYQLDLVNGFTNIL